MKKLILSLTVVAFAVAAQAGDEAKTCPANSEKPACCAKTKACAEQTKASCPAGKNASSKTVSKPLPSPKAQSLAKK